MIKVTAFMLIIGRIIEENLMFISMILFNAIIGM